MRGPARGEHAGRAAVRSGPEAREAPRDRGGPGRSRLLRRCRASASGDGGQPRGGAAARARAVRGAARHVGERRPAACVVGQVPTQPADDDARRDLRRDAAARRMAQPQSQAVRRRAEGPAGTTPGPRAPADDPGRVLDVPEVHEDAAEPARRGLREEDQGHPRRPPRARVRQPRRDRRGHARPLPGLDVGSGGESLARDPASRAGPSHAAVLDAALVSARQLREVGEGRRQAARAGTRRMARAGVAVDRPP